MKRHIIRALRGSLGDDNTLRVVIAYRRLRSLLQPAGAGLAGTNDDTVLPRPGKRAMIDAISDARALPGGLDDRTLETLYNAGANVRTARWFGAHAEGLQAATVLYAGGARCVETERSRLNSPADLVIVQKGVDERELADVSLAAQIMRLDGASVRQSREALLRQKLAGGGRLRVVVVNDVGFQYGAGVATRRQVQSFMIAGWDVALVAWDAGLSADTMSIAKLQAPGRWLGAKSLRSEHYSVGRSVDQIRATVMQAVMDLKPDFVLVGNIHGAKWPIDLIPDVRDAGYPIAAYMHDLHWVTGRCAYPGRCRAYLEGGCTAACPTAEQYPALPRDEITGAWQRRAELFAGADPIPLIANSNWTRDAARKRFGRSARVETGYLALDTVQFRPMDRALARRLLGIQFDGPIVLMGSVNVTEERKCGPLFLSLIQRFQARSDMGVLLFGHGSEEIACTKAFGLVTDERRVAMIYAAADIFVGTAREEAFGQTLIEAQSAGLPVVAFRVDGVPEAVADQETGLLVDDISVDAIVRAVDKLLEAPSLREKMAAQGMLRSAERFSLKVQAASWKVLLEKLFAA